MDEVHHIAAPSAGAERGPPWEEKQGQLQAVYSPNEGIGESSFTHNDPPQQATTGQAQPESRGECDPAVNHFGKSMRHTDLWVHYGASCGPGFQKNLLVHSVIPAVGRLLSTRQGAHTGGGGGKSGLETRRLGC